MVTLTEKAARRVKDLAAKNGKPGGFLRLKVESGGCSGLSYIFEITDAAGPDDLASETSGAKVVVDKKSDMIVAGSMVDFVETLMKAGFEIKNPKATGSCSCGTSFSV